MQVSTSGKRQNEVNRQQLKKTSLDKFAHAILIKMAIDIVLPRLNSYKITFIFFPFFHSCLLKYLICSLQISFYILFQFANRGLMSSISCKAFFSIGKAYHSCFQLIKIHKYSIKNRQVSPFFLPGPYTQSPKCVF